jgi:peptidyl-prolyl cis-trans isomerase D
MLTQIREKFAGGIAIAILAVIGVSFVFFGANLDFRSSSFAATVDGSEIPAGVFENTYRQQLDRNPSLAQLPPEYRLRVREGILDALIRERLVELHLADAGYQISDEQVDASIQRVPEFQVDGVFDLETAETLLLQIGYTTSGFRAAQRRQMREAQLRGAIAATALVTPAEYRRYLNLVAEQRLVSFAKFDIEGVAAEVEVSDEMTAAFYDADESLFLLPETATIEYIELSRAAVAETIEISEQAIDEHYLDSQSRYVQDEQRQARHILILFNDDEDAAEAVALDLLARINAGESFEELATEYSMDGGTAAAGGDLGLLTQTQLPAELGSAIFTMQLGDVTGPISSDFGFHLVRLDLIAEQGPLPLEQVRGELLAELRDRETEGLFRDLERRASDAVFDNADMQAIADVIGLKVQTAEGFQRSGGDPFGNNQAAIDAVFDERVLIDGDVSEVIELDADRSAIFKVVEHIKASKQPLEDVREQIETVIRNREAETIVFDQALQLMQALESGAEFGVTAESLGATVSGPSLVARQGAEMDQGVVAQVFQSRKPGQGAPVRGQVANQGGGYTVFSLEAVLPGRPESIPLPERDAGKERLAQLAGGAAYTAFVQSLYENADIVINNDIVAASDSFQ